MLQKSKNLRSRVALLATAGITGALLVGAPMAANAVTTVQNFNSTTAADYPALQHTGGNGGTDWAPWTDLVGGNAPLVTGAFNWNGRAGWAGHDWAVQDDGSGTNNALWVQKAQAGCKSSGIQLAATTNGNSLISSANKVITLKVKAADANVPIEATLTDAYGGHTLTVSATATTANTYNTVSFNFANATVGSYVANFSYSKLSVVFDPQNAIAGTGHDDWGTGCIADGATNSKVYIVDDLTYDLTAGTDPAPGPDVAHKLTFEPSDALGGQAAGSASDAKWAGSFGSGGSGINNPPVAHTGKALEFNKAGGDAWTGLNLVQAAAGEVITSSNYKTISFDYYSPDSGNSPVELKLTATDSSSVRAVFTATHGWHTFSIDMSTLSGANGVWSSAKNYTQLVLYPDWSDSDIMPAGLSNVAMTGQKYYIDNVTYNGYALPTKTGKAANAGTAKVGRVLTASGATFAGNTVRTSYKWYRCTVQGKTAKATAPVAADKCTLISGATAATYLLKAADKGKYVRVAIVGTNVVGSVYALAPSSAKVG